MALLEDIDMIFTREKCDNLRFNGLCHDCEAPVQIWIYKEEEEEGKIIEGGALYKSMDKYYYKCDECFQKDKTLRNFMPCETYSRVVGYLRPITQWNKGKSEEFEMRKEFTMPEVKCSVS